MKTLEQALDTLHEDYEKMHECIKHELSELDEAFGMTAEDYREEARRIRHELSIKEGVIADVYGIYAQQADHYLFCLHYEEPYGFEGQPYSTRAQLLAYVLEHVGDGTGITSDCF